MRARARPLFLRTVFQILFRISQWNGKNENPKTDISALKSVFGFRVPLEIRNPDFENLNPVFPIKRTHNLVPRVLSYPSLRSGRERDPGWVWSRGPRTKLIPREESIVSRFFCLVRFHRSRNDRKGKTDLLSLQLAPTITEIRKISA